MSDNKMSSLSPLFVRLDGCVSAKWECIQGARMEYAYRYCFNAIVSCRDSKNKLLYDCQKSIMIIPSVHVPIVVSHGGYGAAREFAPAMQHCWRCRFMSVRRALTWSHSYDR